jgi:hypothetical protein
VEKLIKKREVKMLPGKKAYYANTETPESEQKDGFKGKFYYSFAFGKSVFNVHEDDSFIKDWNESQVAELAIDIEEQGASLLNHATYTDLLNEAKFDGEVDYARNRYKYEANKPLTVANLENTAGL